MNVNMDMMGPILAQVILSLIVLLYMASRRLPALAARRPSPEQLQQRKTYDEELPASARFPSENYKNLFELPVLFFVLSFCALITGLGGTMMVTLAWIFVATRVVHSLIHCTYNNVMHRFLVFLLGVLVVIVMLLLLIMRFWMA
ncbi:MAPEG family protein [Kordiimonas gwangyangensis]|uniref:MAPEG family protein n=1 Tax=Kordiimonas gwangyangensis TaxID=288022 RepID=UPI00037901FE|nr:MAPEG family protein [Kordiimonas gwangyangensis]